MSTRLVFDRDAKFRITYIRKIEERLKDSLKSGKFDNMFDG